MIAVQRIVVPDTKERSWVLFDTGKPMVPANEYLLYLHRLGRSVLRPGGDASRRFSYHEVGLDHDFRDIL